MQDDLQRFLMAALELSPERLPQALGELEEARCRLWARLSAPVQSSLGSDELISIEEAARRVGMSEDYLYRHSKEFPFTRRIGRKLLFSSAGIDSYINQNDSVTARRRGSGVLSVVRPTAERRSR